MTDAEVIDASVGDPQRFATIFDGHVTSIHRFLERRCGADGADSRTGECFRIAFERRAAYRLDRPDALPWLYGIADNVLRQRRRTERRRVTAGLRIEASGRPDAPPHEALADRLNAEAAWPAVQTALSTMRPEERDVVLLVAWEDLTYGDVADVLAIPGASASTKPQNWPAGRPPASASVRRTTASSSTSYPRPTPAWPPVPGPPTDVAGTVEVTIRAVPR